MKNSDYLLKELIKSLNKALTLNQPSILESALTSLSLNNSYSDEQSITLFTSDDFSKPAFLHCQQIVNSLINAGFNIDCIRLPASHYVGSLPSHEILEIANSPLNLCSANQQIIEVCGPFHECPQFNDLLSCLDLERNSAFCDLMHALNTFLNRLPIQEIFDFSIFGFPAVMYASRDLSLTYKTSLEDIDTQLDVSRLLRLCKMAIWAAVMIAASGALNPYSIYTNTYTSSMIFAVFAKQRSRHTSIVRMVDPHFCSLMQLNNVVSFLPAPPYGNQVNSLETLRLLNRYKLSKNTADSVRFWVANRVCGTDRSAYSRPVDKRSVGHQSTLINRIRDCKMAGGKIISAFTSSPDETVCQLNEYILLHYDLSHLSAPPYPNQEEWLESLFHFFGTERPSDLLVVRVHPRLAADMRGLGESTAKEKILGRYRSASRQYNNIVIVPPDDQLSSYQLGLESDLSLTAYSSISLELALINVPVMQAFIRTKYGASALSPLALSRSVYESVSAYHDALRDCLDRIGTDSVNNPHVLDRDEAAKALICNKLGFVIDLDSSSSLHEALISPKSLLHPLQFLFSQNFLIADC